MNRSNEVLSVGINKELDDEVVVVENALKLVNPTKELLEEIVSEQRIVLPKMLVKSLNNSVSNNVVGESEFEKETDLGRAERGTDHPIPPIVLKHIQTPQPHKTPPAQGIEL